MWNALLLAALLAAPVPATSLQGPPHGKGPESRGPEQRVEPPARPADKDYDDLVRAYAVQLRDYETARLRVARKQLDPAKAPPHPAIAWWPRFSALADQESGSALGWMLFSLAPAKPDDIERRELAPKLVDRLLAKHADEQPMLDAIQGLRQLYESLGVEGSVELYARIFERSTHPEIQAAALLARAWVIRKGHPDDPKQLSEVEEIHRTIVFGFPGTSAAREATNALHPGIEAEFLTAERRWISDVEALQAAGKPPESWPPQPMHAFQARFLPFSAAGDRLARRFTDNFYPAYAQAEREGQGVGLAWLADGIAKQYGSDPDTWGGIRLRILRAIWRQYPDAKWVRSSLESLRGAVSQLPPEMLAETFEPLLERSTDREVTAIANLLLADSLRARGDQHQLERAIELYQKVVDLFPEGADQGLAYEASSRKARLLERMPGAKAPAFRATDAEGVTFELADYKGRVVVLEFWTFTNGLDREDCQARSALIARMGEKPFHWIGANVDPTTVPAYQLRAGELGVTWRSAILYSNSDPNVDVWDARPLPATYVIDAAGVIRGRNLPWNELVALVEKLTAEAPGSAPK